MTKETIKLFSEMHAEPSWLADLRQKAFDKIESLELPHEIGRASCRERV